jgi:malic enzyme
MMVLHKGGSSDGRIRFETDLRGARLLSEPLCNKGTAFSAEERNTFGLEGLLPAAVSTVEQQARRVYENIVRKSDPLAQYIRLTALQDRNEHLFYRVLMDHLEEFLPVVYTPTVGQASKDYSHIFQRGRGIWITPRDRGRIRNVLANARFPDVRLIVATDNQAILGIGDQGAGGMVIPIGKLAIYCAAAGLHPAETLPVSLDVGTENQTLLDDELYLGWRHRRLRGNEYLELIEEFVEAVRELFPQALIQWEDFQKANAFALLDEYRNRLPSFNDDIQGTGATALAGLLTAARAAGVGLPEQSFVVVGGGAAGVGIARQIHSALSETGREKEAVLRSVAVLDSRGLIAEDRPDLEDYKRSVAWTAKLAGNAGLESDRDLESVVRKLGATVLIGTSGQPGIFSEAIVRLLARNTEQPVILPFSNPNDLSEAQPADVLRWTEGRALVASGSPFAPVSIGDRKIHIGQGNNALIFPGIGLGSLVAGARVVSDGMFRAAAKALADSVTDEEIARGQLYPAIDRLREVTQKVAVAVVRQAVKEGLGRALPDSEAPAAVDSAMWLPEYPELVPV